MDALLNGAQAVGSRTDDDCLSGGGSSFSKDRRRHAYAASKKFHKVGRLAEAELNTNGGNG